MGETPIVSRPFDDEMVFAFSSKRELEKFHQWWLSRGIKDYLDSERNSG